MANWRVRDAVVEDVPDILRMIKVMKSASTFHCFHFLFMVKPAGQINLTAGHTAQCAALSENPAVL